MERNSKRNSKKTRTKKKRFSLEARLSRNQRKYCSCLIDVRRSIATKKNGKAQLGAEYPICYSSIRKRSGYDSKKKRPLFNKMMKPGRMKCDLAYNYQDMTLKNVQLLSKSKKIPIKYKNNKTNKITFYKKTTLVKKITQQSLDKLTNKTNKTNKKTNKTKKTK